MNFIEYFKDTDYVDGQNDCWTFVQKVFKDEHNLTLPDYPIMQNQAEIKSFLTTNIPYKIVKKAKKGDIVYFHNGKNHHAAYALDDKKIIHKTFKGVRVDKIPKNAIIYEILDD